MDRTLHIPKVLKKYVPAMRHKWWWSCSFIYLNPISQILSWPMYVLWLNPMQPLMMFWESLIPRQLQKLLYSFLKQLNCLSMRQMLCYTKQKNYNTLDGSPIRDKVSLSTALVWYNFECYSILDVRLLQQFTTNVDLASGCCRLYCHFWDH
jgi:hypothetical protein